MQPFRWRQWFRLAIVGMLAGELSSGGGCNGNFQFPARTGRSDHFFSAVQSAIPMGNLPTAHPGLFIGLVALLLIAAIVLMLVLMYVSSVFRFILFDSVVAKYCEIRGAWTRRQAAGFRLFLWQLLIFVVSIMALTIFVGIPAGLAFLMGWLKQPNQHLVPLILGGMLLFFILAALFVGWMLVYVLTKDFVVPQMALEDVSAFEAWRRLLPMLNTEKGPYAGYIGMKIVLALGAAIAIGIVATIVVIVLLLPATALGVVAVLGGKAAGLTWTLYTITLAIVVGSVLLVVLIYAVALVSVPAIVFFPAYSIYFFASRYPPLHALLHPVVAPAFSGAPQPPPEIPPEAPPLPPSPEPIG